MPRGQKSKLRAREKRRQNRAEPQDLERVQAAAGEEEEAACSSSSIFGEASSSSTGALSLQMSPSAPDITGATARVSFKRSGKAKGHVQKSKNAPQASTSAESSGQDLLTQKASLLVEYLLCQYQLKKPIRKAEMLKIVHKWYKKDFPEILKRATDHMDLIYGLELKEDKPNGNFYSLFEPPDAVSLNKCWRFPRKGILMPLLGMIFLNGNCASEAEIWEFLNIMGVYEGQYHFVFGEPRKLIMQDLVREEYLLYLKVPYSDPPYYEFFWGPRAEAEISKMKVLEFLAKFNDSILTDFPLLYEEALQEEQERAQTRAQSASTSMAGPPSEASGSSSTASSCVPHPE